MIIVVFREGGLILINFIECCLEKHVEGTWNFGTSPTFVWTQTKAVKAWDIWGKPRQPSKSCTFTKMPNLME